MGRLPAAVVVSVLAAAGCLAAGVAEARAQTAADLHSPATMRVRGFDPRARLLLDEGRARSETFRHLCDVLEQGDLIVFVQVKTLNLPARTSLVTDSAAPRIVCITLRPLEFDDVLIAWLGHELQHAVEIMSAPAVVNTRTLEAFYRTEGQMGTNGLCTREAQQARLDIAWELIVSRKTRK